MKLVYIESEVTLEDIESPENLDNPFEGYSIPVKHPDGRWEIEVMIGYTFQAGQSFRKLCRSSWFLWTENQGTAKFGEMMKQSWTEFKLELSNLETGQRAAIFDQTWDHIVVPMLTSSLSENILRVLNLPKEE